MLPRFTITVYFSRGDSSDEDVNRRPMASAQTSDGRTVPVELTVGEYEALKAVFERCQKQEKR